MQCDDWIDIGTVCRLEAGHEGMHEDDGLRWEWKPEDHEIRRQP